MECPAVFSHRVEISLRARESCKVTAIVLALFSLFFVVSGSALLGWGMSQRMMSIGMGLIPYLGGWFSLALGVGTLACSTILALSYFLTRATK